MALLSLSLVLYIILDLGENNCKENFMAPINDVDVIQK